MPNLKDQIQALASDFANSIVKAFHGASFADIAALTTAPSSGTKSAPKAKRKRGRPAKKAAPATKPAPAVKALPAPKVATPATAKKASGKPSKMRRGPAEIAVIITKIVDLVAKKPEGMRAEDIGKALGLKSNELPRPLKEGVASKKLSKKGVKRATTYFAAKK